MMDTDVKLLLTPEGAPKQFYVEPDCCLLCGVPESIAPELFATGENHCALKRQPTTDIEVDKVIRAMWSSEVDCIRYSGTDETILRRLGQAGMSDQADDPRAASAVPLTRDRVTFTFPEVGGGPSAVPTIAEAFRRYLKRDGITVLPAFLGRNIVRLSWFGHQFHAVTFQCVEGELTMAGVLTSKSALVGLAWRVDDWLRFKGATAISWQASENSECEDGRSTPI
jgi:hypothetical protein